MRSKRMIQSLIGLSFLVISAICIYVASASSVFQDKDCTAALLFIPLGVWLIFSKDTIID